VAVDVDRHATPGLVVAALVLLHPAAGTPAVVTDVRRGGVRHAVPAGDPDPVGQHVVGPGLAGVVEDDHAGAGAGVHARHVAEVVHPLGPGLEERQRGLAAGDVVD